MSYTQLFTTPVKRVDKQRERVDMFNIQSHQFDKKQTVHLKNRGECAKIMQICQNELTNHTHVTALERTVFVHVFLRRLAALY